jgi:protein O-mannosyl-transferase
MLSTRRYVDLAEYSMLGRPLWSSFLSQVSAVPVGLGLLLQPWQLSIDYGIPLATHLGAPTFVLGALLYLAAAIGIMLTRSPAVAVGLALWLAALLPTQSFVPKLDALTNRPLSLALAGLLLAVARLIVAASNRMRTSNHRRAPLIPLAAFACGGLLFTATAAMTLQRAQLFRSDLVLWQDAAMKSLDNIRPHLQYAALLKRAGRDRDAWSVAAAAQRIDPLSSQAATMVRLFRTGDTPQ